MEKAEYIDIILIGYFEEREYFKQFLIRQFKIAESKHIEEHEFFSKCLDAVKIIMYKLNEIPKIEEVNNVKIPLTYLSKEFNKGHIGYEDLKEITLRIKEAKDSINNSESLLKTIDKFKNFEEVLKSNNLLNIDTKINMFYSSLLDNEKNDFLKWLELEILAEWKIRQYSNQNNKNINSPFLLTLAGKFNQTIEYVENWIKEKKANIIIEEPQQSNNKNPDEVNQHPKHNPNDWNTDCFELFKYLFDEYYNDKKRTKTKLICIWFYLSEYNPEKYNLKITKDNYKIFIKENYGITITNTDKPDNYDNKVLDTIHEHRQNFESNLK